MHIVQQLKIELLAPAKNIECGIAAINCGADAVYIGAPKFGARVAAGNSISDIEKLIAFAHKYRAKVYVTINTILYDQELEEVEKLIQDLYQKGVDAIIIQDMGILEMNLPPVPLIASTQADNCNLEKVKFFEKIGLHRVILARELSLVQIKEIRANTSIELESFVHGSLCVCYSGRCYLSYAMGGRSANRGECAQPCRLKYNLVDDRGNIIVKNKHLLSLKDLNLSEHLEELLNAGITSFKIEGRLKDVPYVKNTVAYYRKKIDKILDGTSFCKASSGKTNTQFTPDLNKTFNRGYTSYFLYGRGENITSFDTPKSTGESIGIITKVFKNYILIDSDKTLHNGDGICFFPEKDEDLHGTKINKVEGDKIYPDSIDFLRQGLQIFRNFDIEFDTQIRNDNSKRKINVTITIADTESGFTIHATDENEISASVNFTYTKKTAHNKIKMIETIKKQLSKSGDTIFDITEVLIKITTVFFIPISILNSIRRDTLQKLETLRINTNHRNSRVFIPNNVPFPEKKLNYQKNISNQKAIEFYKRHGVEDIEMAFEINNPQNTKNLMTLKHCLKFSLGNCPKFHVQKNITNNEKLYLQGNHKNLNIKFDCDSCELQINI